MSAISSERHEYHQRIDTHTVVLCSLIVGLCETASLSQLKGTLSIFDLRRSDGGIGVYPPGEEQYGRGRWLWLRDLSLGCQVLHD